MSQSDFLQIVSQARSLLAQGKLDDVEAILGSQLVEFSDASEVASLKAEVERRRKLLGGMGKSRPKAKQLRCPTCNAAIKLINATSESCVCGSCGSFLDLREDQARLIVKQRKPKVSYEPVLKVGDIGTINGTRYQVTGELWYDDSLSEWCSEDGRYYKESWQHIEWQLQSERNEVLYISQDEEGIYLSKKIIPDNPQVPDVRSSRMSILKKHREQRIKEHGSSVLTYLEGELSWIPNRSDKIRFAEYDYYGHTFSCSWSTRAGEGFPYEIEFFDSKTVPYLEVLHWFDLKEKIAAEEARLAKEKFFRTMSSFFFATAGFLVFLSILFGAWPAAEIYHGSLSIHEIPEEGIIMGPFELTEEGSVHQLKLQMSLDDNTYSWIGAELLDSEYSSINALEGDFWRESGRDSEGAWSESDLRSTMNFRLDKAGSYHLRIFNEKGTAQRGTLRFQIREGLVLVRYLLLTAVLAIGFGCILRFYLTANPIYLIIGLAAALAWILRNAGDD